MKAKTWDIFHSGNTEWCDKNYFLHAIEQGGQPVLDVGCGTGRLLLEYGARGIDIDGADNSREMLALCQKKAEERGVAVNLLLQDMRNPHFGRRYGTIIVPSATFQLVTDLDESRRTMAHLRDSMRPGGVLAAAFAMPCHEAAINRNLSQRWELSAEVQNDDDASVYRLWSRQRFDFAAQLEHLENRFEIWQGGRLAHSEYQVRSPANRWYTKEQAVKLFLDLGLVRVEATCGIAFESTRFTGEMFYVSGQKAKANPE